MKRAVTKSISLLLVGILLIGVMNLSVCAESTQQIDKPTTGVESAVEGYGEGIYSEPSMTRSSTLINRISLTIAQVDNRGLRVNFATGGIAVMAKIGGKDITIERWENGKWVTVCQTDRIAENVSFHSGSYFSPTNLPAGYYYRATILHYAKEQGWFFPGSQELYNETTYILLQ